LSTRLVRQSQSPQYSQNARFFHLGIAYLPDESAAKNSKNSFPIELNYPVKLAVGENSEH